MADVPREVRDRLGRIEDPSLRAAVERAAAACHDPRVLTEAERMARARREREQAERQDTLTKVADAALAGDYGADCRAAATKALVGGRTWESLERVGRIVFEAKKMAKGKRIP